MHVDAYLSWLRTALTFAAGGVGGWLFDTLGVPLPWLLGSLLIVAGLGLAGLPTTAPVRSRQIGQVIAGVAVGLYFTPAVATQLLALAPAMVACAALSIVASIGLSRRLGRAAGVDGTTAYFSSLPGGVAEMAVLAERHGADTALVALAQSLRIVCVVLIVPPLITVSGLSGSLDYVPVALPLRPAVLVGMLVFGFALALVFNRYRVTNPWLLAGLTVGVATGFGELPLSRVPEPVIDLSQLLIGCALGTRFRRETRVHLRRFIPATVAGTLTLMLFNAGLAAALVPLTGRDIATLVLATAPGGVAEMSITAKVLQLGVPVVTAFHLTRILLIILVSDPIYRVARPMLARHPAAAGD